MKQVLMILAGVMAVASGRMLQDENITSTLSNSSLIDEAATVAKPELIDENTNTSEVASPDGDNGTVTPWRVKPQPLPANFVITAKFDSSDEDTVFAYTVAVAGNDASISPNTGSDNPVEVEDDPVLYFKLDQQTCDPNATAPTSFMTSKYQLPDVTKSSRLPTVTEKKCWKAPTGYYINTGIPTVHRKVFQLLTYFLNPEKNVLWTYDGTISTTQGKGKLLLTCQTNAFACIFIAIELNCQPQINLSSLFVSQTKLTFGGLSTMTVKVVIHLHYHGKRVYPSNTALVFKL
jgi:hypothetical protein